MCNEVEYDSAFTFIFSPRIGTPAAKMEDNTPLSEKEERLQRLNKVINNYSLEANKQYLDKDVKVLIEGISEKDPNKVFGYTQKGEEQFTDVNFMQDVDEEECMIEFKINEPTKETTLLLETMVLGLQTLEANEEYEDYIDLIFEEV